MSLSSSAALRGRMKYWACWDSWSSASVHRAGTGRQTKQIASQSPGTAWNSHHP